MARSKFKTIAMVLAAGVSAGCNPGNPISGVTVQPLADNTALTVTVSFTNEVQAVLADSFSLSGYGEVFVNPYSVAEPMQFGITLSMAAFADPVLGQLPETDLLPNSLPIGIPGTLAEIVEPSPSSAEFTLYGYVDTRHGRWLGAAVIFGFSGNQYFPDGYSYSGIYLRDSKGHPEVIASEFGPAVDSSGNLTRPGGLAVFADAKRILRGL